MMNFRFPLFFLFVFALVFCACSNEQKPAPTIPQTNAYSNFYVRYLQDDQELKAEATFKIGDSLKTATIQAIQKVSFEDHPMDLKDLGKNGIRYRSKKSGQAFKGNYTFNATINEQQHFDYPISIDPIESFSIKEKKLSRSKGATIAWEGTALKKGELLVVFFINPDKKPASLTINGPSNASEIFLAAKNLSQLKVGTGKLRLIRKVLNKFEEEPQNIASVIEFYTTPIEINIIE